MALKRLQVIISGDAKGAQKAFAATSKSAGGMGANIAHAGKIAAAGLAGVAAATAAVAVKSAGTFEKVGGEVIRLSRLTGLGAKDASRLRVAFQLTGVDAKKSATSLGIFSKGIVGTKFDKFNLGLKDSHGRLLPMHAALLKVSDRFKGMPDGARKTALAMTLFGKSGRDMLPFLSKGSAGIKELEKQSDKFGTTLSGKDTDAVKASIKQHRLFKLGMEGLQIQIGRYVLPALQKMITFLAQNMPKAIAVVRAILTTIGPAVGAVVRAIGSLAQWVRTHWSQIKANILGVVTWFRTWVVPTVLAVAHGVAAGFGALVGWVRQHWESISQTVRVAIAVVRGIIVAAVAVITTLWRTFGGTLLAIITSAWNLIKGVVQGAINIISGVVRFFIAVFTGEWGKAWNAIVQILRGVWQIMSAIVTDAINGVVNVVRLVGGALSLVWSGIWAGISGAVSFAWTTITGFVSAGINGVLGVINLVGSAIAYAWGGIWGGLTDIVSGIWSGISSAVVTGINDVIGVLNGLIGAVNWVLDKLPGGLKVPAIGLIGRPTSKSGPLGPAGPQRRALGGMIGGAGSGDHVKALLEPGEFVMRKSAVQKYGADTFAMMNGGWGDGGNKFSAGGSIGNAADIAAAATLRAAWNPVRGAAEGAISHLPLGSGILRDLANGGSQKIFNGISSWIDSLDHLKGELDKKSAAAFRAGATPKFSGVASGGLLGRVMAAIRQHESGGNYGAQNPYGSASGAYQVLGTTWGGYGGFPTAASAPPHIQDLFAASRMGPVLAAYGNDPGAVAALWFVGQPGRANDHSPVGGPGNTGSVYDFAQYVRNLSSHIAGVPGFHTGGMFHAPTPGGKGLAVLRDRERVSVPSSGGDGVHIYVHGSILTDRQFADTVTRLQREGKLPRGPVTVGR